MKASIALCSLFLCAIQSDLIWAPIRTLRKPFLTFLNDAYDPSFMSTHYNTHKQETFSMFLPRNTFFGLICGACFSSGYKRRKGNLTMSIFNDTSFASDNKIYWSRGRYNKCLMVYSITHIEEEHGTITCVLQLGRKTFKHEVKATASYYVGDRLITRIDRNMSDYTQLDCDDKINNRTTTIRMTIWWYENKDNNSITPAYVSKRTALPRSPPVDMNVACATFYGVHNVLRVYQQRYHRWSYSTTSAASYNDGLVIRIWENCLMAALISFL